MTFGTKLFVGIHMMLATPHNSQPTVEQMSPMFIPIFRRFKSSTLQDLKF